MPKHSSDEDDAFSANVLPHDRLSVPYPADVIRLLVASYPDGLVCRDKNGYTPLLLAMVENESLPDVEIVDLLLGKRTPTHDDLPEWAEDMPLHRLSDARYMNPAMLPFAKTRQLPLHIAAEELLADPAIMESIRDSYPGAIGVQDSLGRTPLHISLGSYRKIPVDPRVLSLLYSDQVAQVRDDRGRLPLDVLLDSASTLPPKEPRAWAAGGSYEESTIYQRFVDASIIGSAKPHTMREKRAFLHRLRNLPPWLRKRACSSSFVQELILEDLANPWKFAFFIFEGLLVLALITVFRLQINGFVNTSRSSTYLATWYTYAVYTSAFLRIAFQATLWAVTASIRQFHHLCLFNIWRWIDFWAMFLTVVTSVLLYGNTPDGRLLSLSTVTTGLLWLSFLGYLSTWWYGVSLFLGGLYKVSMNFTIGCAILAKFSHFVGKISCYLAWPAILFGSLITMFAQMLYTQLQINCSAAIHNAPVCSVRDSYRVIYMLVRGDPLVDPVGFDHMSNDAIVIITFFLLLLFLFFLAFVVMILLAATRLDFADIALGSFWEPNLAFVVTLSDLGLRPRRRGVLACWDVIETRMEETWHFLLGSVVGTRGKHWYAKAPSATTNPFFARVFFCLVACVAMPLWIVAGAFTLGIMWPPQVRRAIVKPMICRSCWRNPGDPTNSTVHEVARLRDEIARLKIMSYERSGDVEKELRDLKAILCAAMKED